MQGFLNLNRIDMKKAKKRIKITVTAKDIRDHSADNDSMTRCPIATAIKRTGKRVVAVNPLSIWIGNNMYDIPYKAALFQINLIYKKPVKPFSFYMTEQ